MKIDLIKEFELTEQQRSDIALLLQTCFPNTDYDNRAYFKQLPHYRLLLTESEKLIGQLGIDYRVMSLNKKQVTVFGVVDLVIHPAHQRTGGGTLLMQEFERVALKYKQSIDFLFLVTDQPAFYERLGFIKTNPNVTWLKIYKGETYGIGNETITDSFLMYKSISGKSWEESELDMMGYWY